MKLPYTTVDVFTSTRYTGNPLAIVRVPASDRDTLSEQQKQRIAREFNFSETVFLHDVQPGEDFADYDIFTPASRLPFAGHPTIGTAIYVAQNAEKYKGVTALRTLAGRVPCGFDAERNVAVVEVPQDVHVHRQRLRHPLSGEENVPIASIVKGMAFALVRMAGLEELGRLKTGLLRRGSEYDGTLLDAGSGWDCGYTGSLFYHDLGVDQEDAGRRLLRTRMLGEDEDPGTGSASCALAAWLSLQEGGRGEGERTCRYHLVQGVEMGRRCDIFVEVVLGGDGSGVKEVRLSGESVGVMEGVLEV